MKIPFEEHPFRHELLRARQLSEAHDEMKRVIDGVVVPEFNNIIQEFIERSLPWDVKTHGHGVILNFGLPDKPYTIAYYGYPEVKEFEIAITIDEDTTESFRRHFNGVFPSDIKLMFEEFFETHMPDLDYKAKHKAYELHDLGRVGPYQLRIEDDDATSVIATVDDFEEILTMATTLSESFKEKDMIITDEKGALIC